jgi:hypothetical protein
MREPIATNVCADCGEVIRLFDGYWVDRTYVDGGIATLEFASLCENGDIHTPENVWDR